ncbi:hypothetical protein [Caldanaerobius polysaccharolyticus]|nr:hypothetical protein [Caldanaerobius polysaccharolyticus]
MILKVGSLSPSGDGRSHPLLPLADREKRTKAEEKYLKMCVV